METNLKHAEEQIRKDNPWYTESQFQWARSPAIKRIYDQRYSYFRKIIDAEIFKKGKIHILDYGCGDGYWAILFSQIKDCCVVGVDYNPLRIQRAKEAASKANFYQADLQQSNTFGQFDIVFCSQVIEHIQDDILFLTMIKNFMKQDSRLILGTPNEGCLTQRLRNSFKKEPTDHCHFYTEKEITEKLQNTGFIVNDVFREVFYPGHDKLYYQLTSSSWGFQFLQWCTKHMPSQCSDYYFDCVKAS
jgi:2-polyprenyl-3-methyl-5-hydroxy-6-metoxy-1,4-benzoquinol methylase